MATHVYKSTTDFDRSLELDIVENVGSYTTSYRWSGFRSLEEADQFADWWVDRMGWGYSPSAHANEIDGKFVVTSTRANSCD